MTKDKTLEELTRECLGKPVAQGLADSTKLFKYIIKYYGGSTFSNHFLNPKKNNKGKKISEFYDQD